MNDEPCWHLRWSFAFCLSVFLWGTNALALEQVCETGFSLAVDDNQHLINMPFGQNRKRDLFLYASVLGSRFMEAYHQLPEGGHWVDLGGGEGIATLQSAETDPRKLRYTSIDEVGPSGMFGQEITRDGVRFLRGKFARVPNEKIGDADLVTCVVGPLSYVSASNFEENLKKALLLLKPKAKLLLVFDRGGYGEKNRAGLEIKGPYENQEAAIKAFFGRIKGVVGVSVEYGSQWIRVELVRGAGTIEMPGAHPVGDESYFPPIRVLNLPAVEPH